MSKTLLLLALIIIFSLLASKCAGNSIHDDELKTVYFDSQVSSTSPDGSQNNPFKSVEEFIQKLTQVPQTDGMILSFMPYRTSNSTHYRYTLTTSHVSIITETKNLSSLKITTTPCEDGLSAQLDLRANEEALLEELDFELDHIGLKFEPQELDLTSLEELKSFRFETSRVVFREVHLDSTSSSMFIFSNTSVQIVDSMIDFLPESLSSCPKIYRSDFEAMSEYEFPIADNLFELLQSNLTIQNTTFRLLDSSEFKSCAATFFQGSGKVHVDNSRILGVLSIETVTDHTSQFAFLRLHDVFDEYSSEISLTNSLIDFTAYSVEPYPYGLPFIELKNSRKGESDRIDYKGGVLSFVNNTVKNYLGRASLLKYSYWISPLFNGDLFPIMPASITIDSCHFVGPIISQVGSVLNASFYAHSKAYASLDQYSFRPSIENYKPLMNISILNSTFDQSVTSILNENIISIRIPYVNDFDPLTLNIRGNTFNNALTQKSSTAHKMLKSFSPQIIPNYIILPLTLNWRENIQRIYAQNKFTANLKNKTVVAYASYPIDFEDSDENIRYRMLHSHIYFNQVTHGNPFVNLSSFSTSFERQIDINQTIHRSRLLFYNITVEFWDFEAVLNHYFFNWISENIVGRMSFGGLSDQLSTGPAHRNLNVPTQEVPFEKCKQITHPVKGFGIKCILHGHDLYLAGNPTTVTHISLKDTSINQKLFTISMELTDCEKGDYKKHIANTFFCETCPPGFYTLNNTGPCQKCKKNFDCSFGGDWIVTKEGYWRNHTATDQAHKCKLAKNCPFLYNESCIEGTIGPLCDSCDLYNGFVGHGNCARCPTLFWILVNLTTTIMFSFLYQLYLSFDALSFNQSLTDRASEAAVVKSIKSNGYTLILANYFQIISLLSIFHVFSWDSESASNIQQETAFKPNLYFNLECLLLRAVGLPKDSSEELSLYYYKTLIVIALPIVKLLITFLFFDFLRRKSGWKGSFHGALIALCIVTFITEQPELVNFLMPYLHCINFNTESRIPSQLLYTCNTELYLSFRNLIALPTLFGWALGIPLLLVGGFWFSKKDLGSKGMLGRYGQIYGSYTLKRYYWFFINFLQVTLIVSTNWIFNEYDDQHAPMEKGLLLCLIFFTYREAVSLMKPYKEVVLNQTDKFSNVAYFSTLFLAIFQVELKKGSKYSPISIHLAKLCLYGIILVNLCFVGMILFRFGELYQEQLEWASDNVKPLKFIKTKVRGFSTTSSGKNSNDKPEGKDTPPSSKDLHSKKTD